MTGIGHSRRGFTLVEMLLVVSIIGVLVGLFVPALHGGMELARDVQCKSNLRVLGTGVLTYAARHGGAFPPVAARGDPVRYWWGADGNPPDYSAGVLTDCLDREAGDEDGLFECPSQPWGTYVPQGRSRRPTTTYGYNGYYLCPASVPGWSAAIGRRPWRTTESVKDPGKVFVLADTLLPWRNQVKSCCLLDPPWTYTGRTWRRNRFTTLCFRHLGRANVFFADGHVDGVEPTALVDEEHEIGYVGESNAPHYVPDWRQW